jgi:alpha-glucosidase (family GH31 glycosyl hydrolase)
MLPYIYTQFVMSTMNGSPVMRALWFNFPDDITCLSIDRQFMIGPSVLLSPVSSKDTKSY